MKVRNTLKATVVIGLLSMWGGYVFAQSSIKEGFNQFALYSNSGDVKLLDNARKHIDDAYKTRKDTTAFRNNLLRSLVYSTLAVVDSNRTRKYPEDPIEIASRSLSKLKDKQLAFESEPEINHIKKYLSNAHLIAGNRAIAKKQFEEAYKRFRWVDSVGIVSNNDLQYNLAILSEKTKRYDESIQYLRSLLAHPRTSNASYYTKLADIYEAKNDQQRSLEALRSGREQFSGNQEILFRLVDFYQKQSDYSALLEIIDDAIKMDPQNTYLYYLAGYANDVLGDFSKAKSYYSKLIDLDPNDYKGNYALGLIHLREYLQDTKNKNYQAKAEEFLLRANQIKPTAYNALQSLAILYKKDGNIIQLERVNNILNQLSFN